MSFLPRVDGDVMRGFCVPSQRSITLSLKGVTRCATGDTASWEPRRSRPVMRNEATLPATRRESESLLEAARRLHPLVREHAEAAERDRRVPRPVVDALLEAGLFHMSAPRAFGGYEISPVDMIRCIEEVARGDASTGWCVAKATCSTLVARALPLPVR